VYVCSFWYRLTRVVPDKIQRAVKWLCVCVCVCVCLSLCLSVTCHYCIETAEQIKLIFCMQVSLNLCYAVILEIGVLPFTKKKAFSALTLLVGWQEGHLACKNWVVRYWHGFLSGARCKWFAYGPADGTATPSSLASLKSRMVYLSVASLPRLSFPL